MILKALFKWYRKINVVAVNNSDQKETLPYEEQMKFLRRFDEPSDDYERSYYKYKCFCKYCYYKRKKYLIAFNIGSMLVLPIAHLKLRNRDRHNSKFQKVDAVIENVPWLKNDDILPKEIKNRYTNIHYITTTINPMSTHLSEAADHIYKELRKRYFFNFYFRMIVMLKLAQFSEYLETYNPEAIVYYSCEREFSGPLQTLLCEQSSSKYIAFMHGDYLSTLSFAFQRYTAYYVWDKAYIDMFTELCCAAPMVVYKPRKMAGIANVLKPEECTFFATYYFSDETLNEAQKIHEVFSNFETNGLRTKIRPHPRYSDIPMLKRVFHDIEIEDPTKKVLGDSISESLYIVGINTTVLSEAFFSKKEVVIDDVSNPQKYSELDKRGYIMIKRPHILLSDMINKHKDYDSRFAFYKF